MSEFFESEIVREELEEINKMQQKIYGSMMTFAELDSEEKLEHINEVGRNGRCAAACVRVRQVERLRCR